MLISTLHRNVTSSHSMHLFLHLCIMYHAWNFVMHPLLIFIESVTTNNWSLAIDPISDSCVVVPRSNAYETIDVRYRWEATRSVHLHPLVRVDSSGSARPEIGSKHVDTRGDASPHSGHPCPTISTSFLFVSTGMSLATVYTFFSFDIFIPEIEQEAVLQIEYHFCWWNSWNIITAVCTNFVFKLNHRALV